MKAVLENEQQRLDHFCMVIESHLNGNTAGDKPGLESSDYEMIDMRGHSRQSESAQERQRYKDALKELYSFTFVIEDEGEEEIYPVGKFGVAHPRSPEIPLVLDWRSEMAMRASMFNGETIETPGGDIVGMTQLELDRRQRRVVQANHRRAPKRQSSSLTKRFTEQIKSTFKKPETVPDVSQESFMEQELTKKQKDRSIDGFIATRQAEQNHIIQAPVNTYMIVQGAAGTGKSLTALHRMSYLQYQDERRKMLYLAPNEATIHQLLKDAEHLQIQSVSTMAFDEWLKTGSSKDFSASIVQELLPLYQGHDLFEWADAAIEEWYDDVAVLLRRYEPIKALEDLHERALAIWFGQERSGPAQTERILQMMRSESERTAILNKEKYENELITDMQRWSGDLDSTKTRTLEQIMQENLKRQLAREKREHLQLIDFWKKTTKLEAATIWSIMKQPGRLVYLKKSQTEELLEMWHKLKRPTELDRFFWMYLHYETTGYPDKWSHLFVDEGQTLRPLDIFVLEKLCHGMTVFGDTLQSYRSLEMTSWEQIKTHGKSNWTVEYLTKTFRTAKPIVKVAKEILHDAGHDTSWIDPFDRTGKPVTYLRTKKSNELRTLLRQWQNEGFSICIITPTMERASFLHTKLQLETQLIRSETTKVNNQIIISTIDYLRGMEFDAVLLLDVNESTYPEDAKEARRLYVSLTRALHEVIIHTTNEFSPLLSDQRQRLVINR
jgi:DNA helicase-2/ATP-dependent DNA helicase PcrA